MKNASAEKVLLTSCKENREDHEVVGRVPKESNSRTACSPADLLKEVNAFKVVHKDTKKYVDLQRLSWSTPA